MRSTYAKLAAVAVFFIMLIVYVRFWWLWASCHRARGKAGSLAGVCVQGTVHGGCALESTQDHHLHRSVLKLLGGAWLLHPSVKPNNRCKGLLTTGFSSEAVCTREPHSLASHGSAPSRGTLWNSQSGRFSVITYVLLLSSSSGNWTLMNIPCLGNICFFRIWVCSYFSFFFLKTRHPCLKADTALYI